MQLTSPAFKHNENMPSKYTCDGENINPPLHIEYPPRNTKSFALIVDDPDAPTGTWIHWTVWNIDPTTTRIIENSIPKGAAEGVTSFGNSGYSGPCPPGSTHRYFFKLYALDSLLDLPSTATKRELERAIEPHILEKTELIGLYERKK